MNQLVPIERRDGIATVSSLEVAKDFNKQHQHVIRSIESIIAGMNGPQNQSVQKWTDSQSADCKDYFIPGVYRDRKNRQQPMYYLTRDGFQLLAMGFTGEYALQWKLRYIEAFDQMETTIRKAMQPAAPSPLMALEQTLAVLKGFDVRIEAMENKQAVLEKVVKKADWITGAKRRVESITGRSLNKSGLFLARIYSTIEKSRGVCLASRQARLYKRLKARGEAHHVREVSKLYIISLDEELKVTFDTVLDTYKAR